MVTILRLLWGLSRSWLHRWVGGPCPILMKLSKLSDCSSIVIGTRIFMKNRNE